MVLKLRLPLLSIMIVTSLMLLACSEEKTKAGESSESTVVTNHSVQHVEESKQALPTIDKHYDFTYLEKLPEEKELYMKTS